MGKRGIEVGSAFYKKKNLESIYTHVPPDVKKRLQKLAIDLDQSSQALLRKFLLEGLERHESGGVKKNGEKGKGKA